MELQKQRMSEVNTPRLMAAAKEFNIGANTLIDFLVSKNLSGSDDLKPTSKLSDEMYRVLQGEYQGDKTAKEKADRVELIKAVSSDPKKKKDEQDLSVKKKDEKPKDEPKPVVVEEKVEVTAIETPKLKLTIVEQAPVTPPSKEKEIKAKEVKAKVKEEAPVKNVIEPKQEVITKIDAPELDGPKVLDKIDLSTIDSSTRPKKGTKKKEEPSIIKAAEPVSIIAKEEPVANDAPPVIENILSERLTGPKILGKITLPVDNDTRPKRDDAHKRKRIPIQKKPGAPGAGAPPNNENRGPRPIIGDGGANRGQGGTNRGPQQGGGGPNRGPGQGGGGRFQRPGQGGGANAPRKEDKIIDAKEIQEKLKQTQAKLAGAGGRGKSSKAKYRKEKRDYLTKHKATDQKKEISYK